MNDALRILVIDDDEDDLRDLAKVCLRIDSLPAGFNRLEVYVSSCVKAASDHNAKWHVILCDVVMKKHEKCCSRAVQVHREGDTRRAPTAMGCEVDTEASSREGALALLAQLDVEPAETRPLTIVLSRRLEPSVDRDVISALDTLRWERATYLPKPGRHELLHEHGPPSFGYERTLAEVILRGFSRPEVALRPRVTGPYDFITVPQLASFRINVSEALRAGTSNVFRLRFTGLSLCDPVLPQISEWLAYERVFVRTDADMKCFETLDGRLSVADLEARLALTRALRLPLLFFRHFGAGGESDAWAYRVLREHARAPASANAVDSPTIVVIDERDEHRAESNSDLSKLLSSIKTHEFPSFASRRSFVRAFIEMRLSACDHRQVPQTNEQFSAIVAALNSLNWQSDTQLDGCLSALIDKGLLKHATPETLAVALEQAGFAHVEPTVPPSRDSQEARRFTDFIEALDRREVRGLGTALVSFELASCKLAAIYALRSTIDTKPTWTSIQRLIEWPRRELRKHVSEWKKQAESERASVVAFRARLDEGLRERFDAALARASSR